jgi:ribosomal protein S17E
MCINMNTYQIELVNFIANKKLLGHIVDGEYKPLKASTIANYVSTVMSEAKKERERNEKKGRK